MKKKKKKYTVEEYLKSRDKSISLLLKIRECEKEIKRLKRLKKIFFEEE